MAYYDDGLVRQLTTDAIALTGTRLLQLHRFGDSDLGHARALLDLFDPALNARIADIGCGVGEMARLMKAERPDLEFLLVNPSQAQLDMCPEQFATLCAEAEKLPIERGEVDALMVNYALGHIDLPRFAQQAMRILAPGQKLYVYDLFVGSILDDCKLASDLNYAERSVADVIGAFDQHHFTYRFSLFTDHLPDAIAAVLPSPDSLANTVSCALVFERRDLNP